MKADELSVLDDKRAVPIMIFAAVDPHIGAMVMGFLVVIVCIMPSCRDEFVYSVIFAL